MSVDTCSVVRCDQNCASNIVIATDPEHARETAAKAEWLFAFGGDYRPVHRSLVKEHTFKVVVT
jgi:hypothetical protein